MNLDLDQVYQELPRTVYKLDGAYRLESKTRQFPFVVAHEVKKFSSGRSGSGSEQNSSTPEPPPEEPQVNTDDLWKAALAGTLPAPKTLEIPSASKNGSELWNALTSEGAPEVEDMGANREFLVFHDLEHFLTLRGRYPFSHEIIRCPSKIENQSGLEKKVYREDLCRGRLIFDFDLKKPLPEMQGLLYFKDLKKSLNGGSLKWSDDSSDGEESINTELYVPADFKQRMEALIMRVFLDYYVKVDVNKLIFVWQKSPSTEKFSMHLIIKNAYFSEYWVKQMRVFYLLLEKTAHEHGMSSFLETIDFQIPRRNATFRMLGSSKIGGNPLEIVCCNQGGVDLLNIGAEISIYDCLVGLYSSDHMQVEQSITLNEINYSKIEQELRDSPETSPVNSGERPKSGNRPEKNPKEERDRAFRRNISKHLFLLEETMAEVDLTDADTTKAVELFTAFNDGSFHIRDQVSNIINLDRGRKGPCPISGHVHERENAYLKLKADGHLAFFCRRGCKSQNGSYCVDLGVYRMVEKPKGIVSLNLERLMMVKTAKVVMENNPTTIRGMKVGKATEVSYSKPKNSAKRVAMGTNLVHVPVELRKNPTREIAVSSK